VDKRSLLLTRAIECRGQACTCIMHTSPEGAGSIPVPVPNSMLRIVAEE